MRRHPSTTGAGYGALTIVAIASMCSGWFLSGPVEERDARNPEAPSCAPGRTKYAVVLNGDYEARHRHNVAHAYRSLRRLGFREEHIFVLSCNDPRPEEAVRSHRGFHGKAVPGNLRAVLDLLSKTVDDDDLLVLYGTGHGYGKDGQSSILLDGSSVTANQYRSMVEKIGAGVIVSVMDQCYAGGFPEELSHSHGNVIAMSGTDGKHRTSCGPYSQTFWDAFWYTTADSNGDGAVSVREAHEHAVKNLRALTFEETHGTYLCSGSTQDVLLE